MIERIRRVTNPLTIVAVFAGIAEVAGTFALATVDPLLQPVFIWFVMLFPTVLVALFFLTLNFNAKVLYAPGDFKDERHFLTTISGSFGSPVGARLEMAGGGLEEAPVAAAFTLQLAHKPFASETRELLDAANEFFRALQPKVAKLAADGVIDGSRFGVHADEFYLYSFTIPRSSLSSPTVLREFDMIINVRPNPPEGVLFELIGYERTAVDPESFSEVVVEEIERLVAVQRRA